MIIVNRRCSVVSKNLIAVCNSTTNWKIIYHRIKLNCKITLITKKIFPNWRNLSRFIRTDWKISDFKKSGLDKKKEARTLNIDLRNNCADSSSLILFSYAIKQFTDSKSNFQYCACNWMLHCHVLWNNTEKKGVGSLQFASDFILRTVILFDASQMSFPFRVGRTFMLTMNLCSYVIWSLRHLGNLRINHQEQC